MSGDAHGSNVVTGYEPVQGDRVRIVVEGWLLSTPSKGAVGYYWLGDGTHVHPKHIVSVEKVEPPKPPLPTTPGSVISEPTDSRRVVYYVLQDDGEWYGSMGINVPPITIEHVGRYEVIFAAGAES